MAIVKIREGGQTREMASPRPSAGLRQYTDELMKAGVMLDCHMLRPGSKGVRILLSGSKRTIADSPFLETKEFIAGFWLWQVRSMEEAVEWAKRCPNPVGRNLESQIEILPVEGLEDIPDPSPGGPE